MKTFWDSINRLIKGKSRPTKESFYTKDIFQYMPYKIGDYTYGKPIVYSWEEGARLEIGKFCSIANNVRILLGGNHRVDWITTYPFMVLNHDFPSAVGIKGHPSTNGDVQIGNDVWIGMDVIILSGVHVGNGAVIGAGSIVSKDVPAYSVVAGNPAKVVKKRFSEEIIESLEQIKWWNWSIEEINKNIKTICSGDIQQLLKDNLNEKV